MYTTPSTHTHAHTHTHTCTQTCTHMRTHARTHTRTLTNTHTYSQTHICNHANTCTHIHARSRAHTHTHTHPCTQTVHAKKSCIISSNCAVDCTHFAANFATLLLLSLSIVHTYIPSSITLRGKTIAWHVLVTRMVLISPLTRHTRQNVWTLDTGQCT